MRLWAFSLKLLLKNFFNVKNNKKINKYIIMDKYQETWNTWNNIAELYEEVFMDLDLYNESYNAFLNLLSKPNSSILDIGCGPGNITKYLLSKKPKLKIKGIDVSEKMIKIATKNNPNEEFIIMDSRELDSIKETFDALICGFCIPYLSKFDCVKLIADCKKR